MNTTTPSESTAAPEEKPVKERSLGIISMMIAAALVGLISWDLMVRSKDLLPHVGIDKDTENLIRAERHNPIAWAKEKEFRWEFYWHNAMLNYSYIGVGLGLAWGALAGFVRRKVFRGLGLGLVLGSVGVFAGAYLTGLITLWTDSVGMADEVRPVYDPLLRSTLMHGAAFAMIGLTGGIIVALAGPKKYQLVRLAFSGLIAGILGTIAFEAIAAGFFPMDRTDLPVPEGNMNMLVFAMAPALIISLALWRASSVSTASSETKVASESVPADNPSPGDAVMG